MYNDIYTDLKVNKAILVAQNLKVVNCTLMREVHCRTYLERRVIITYKIAAKCMTIEILASVLGTSVI